MTLAFIDTNILLHYRRLDELDWSRLINAREVQLVVAPVVIRELDEHKFTHPNHRLRRRAQDLCSFLWQKFESGSGEAFKIRNNVALVLGTTEPTVDWNNLQLNFLNKDDQLLASILSARESNPGDGVVLISADLGLGLKAKSRGIRVIAPSAADKLAEEVDVKDKRIQSLESEVRAFKNALPELSLQFAGLENVLRITLKAPTLAQAERISDQMRILREKHPQRDLPAENHGRINLLAMTPLSSVQSRDGIMKYNRRLEGFYEEYEKYLRAEAEFERKKSRSAPLSIEVHNSGKATAQDVGIQLHFPDGFTLFDLDEGENLPEYPEEPEPPLEPGRVNVPNFDFPRLEPQGFRVPSPSAPTITKTNSYEVEFEVKAIKHGYSKRLNTLLLIFDSFESARSFEIAYKLDASNAPDEFLGKLNVVVERAAS